MTFAPPTNYPTGAVPTSIIAADINNDGKVDLICANFEGNTLSVLTNNGTGNFVTAGVFNVGIQPISVTAADVNNDGYMDLICANQSDNTLSVLTNDRNGSFVLSSNYVVAAGPRSVTTADVNGDGKMDLVCVSRNNGVNLLTVLTNNGSGVFRIAYTNSVGIQPNSVVSADVNMDGKIDLISANETIGNVNGGTLTILTNSGSGRFAIASSPGVGIDPLQVIAIDVNGDGKVDLVTANLANSLTILTNNGSGAFALANTIRLSGNNTGYIVATDVNGDGKVDLICTENATSLLVLTNDGSGNFVGATSQTVGNVPNSVTAADVNGDGKPDLICINGSDFTISVLLNTTSTFFPPTLHIAVTGNQFVVYWPAAYWGYILQTITNFSSTNWITVTNGTAVTCVMLTNTLPAAFFRLLPP